MARRENRTEQEEKNLGANEAGYGETAFDANPEDIYDAVIAE